MNIKRAQEIVTSSDMIPVSYNGTPIYINSINNNTETANIHPLNEPNKNQEVSVSTLTEQ
jgi:small acid-soluble spore protein H (minor)